MKVLRFPGAAGADYRGPADPAAGEEIDAALNGELAGAEPAELRALREDVRVLAAPIDEDFERELQARVAEWAARRHAPRPGLRARVAALRAPLSRTPGRLLAVGGVGTLLAVVLLVVVLQGGGGGGGVHPLTALPASGPATTAQKSSAKAQAAPAAPQFQQQPSIPASSQTLSSGTSAPGRLQQLGASVSLAAHGGEGVQQAADAVSRLASGDGGYVESSHVQVRQGGGPSEAQLHLSLPSAQLSSAIAALGRIAPVRAVSQESQDITSSYDNARRRLSDDEAVRRALLHALAVATTQGRIDSLREQLASNREALSGDRSRLHSISHTAATSQLEVTITGGGSVASQSGTLDRGLDDAGHVLAVAAAVALVALAVLVPLALLALLLDALRRTWQRRRREAALDS